MLYRAAWIGKGRLGLKTRQCIKASFMWPAVSLTARAFSRILVNEAGRLVWRPLKPIAYTVSVNSSFNSESGFR